MNNFTYEMPETGEMNVPVRVFASEKIIETIKKEKTTFEQATNVSTLPGAVGRVVLCPDTHAGYGFPIGGVAAFDLKKGRVSPGMVGFDINCGIRLLATDISLEEFISRRKEILHELTRVIPRGLGRGGKVTLDRKKLDEILKRGVQWAVENGFGKEEDIEFCEENGKMPNVNPEDISERAKKRGIGQLGTLGAGNHFLDIQLVEEIFDKKITKILGLKENCICVMIHCGSRGLGHQVASDYIGKIEKEYGWPEVDRGLAHAPINSELGKKYISAMNGAANFAFCNRQIIMHNVREVLENFFPENKNNLIYDIAHNIAKIEKHDLEGKQKEVLVIRKGATRAFSKGSNEIPKKYGPIGQPVLIPGSMSTPSFVLVGTKGNSSLSFSSSAHGAGRAHSRTWANKTITLEDVRKTLKKKDIILEGSTKGTIEESELSYKNVEEVIEITEKAGLSKKIAKLRPLAVLIG